MSYLNYNGQRVISAAGQALIYSFYVINWDGVNDYVVLSGQPDLSGSKTVNFNLWLDKESGYSQNMVFTLGVSGSNLFVELDTNIFRIGISGSGQIGSTKTYSLSGFSGKKLECTVVKTTNSISSFTINGVTQSGSSGISTRPTNDAVFGGDGDFGGLLTDAYVWDVEVVGVGRWYGSGENANTNTAWIDQIGSSNGTVNGAPTLKNLPVLP